MIDAFIIKLLIESNKDEIGIKILMDYISHFMQYKMTKYNFNIIGKYLTQKMFVSWNIVKQYIKNGINSNCAYTITRYIHYASKLNPETLKDCLSFEEIKKLYFDRS